jgi:hypothetical protein
MTNLRKWNTPESWQDVLTSQLNSLANNAFCTPSDAQSFATGLHKWMWLSISLGSINPSGYPYIEVHFLPLNRSGGSTYDDRSAATHLCNIDVTTGSSAKYASIARAIEIPGIDGKFVVGNRTGQTFAASGNVLSIKRVDENLNG